MQENTYIYICTWLETKIEEDNDDEHQEVEGNADDSVVHDAGWFPNTREEEFGGYDFKLIW